MGQNIHRTTFLSRSSSTSLGHFYYSHHPLGISTDAGSQDEYVVTTNLEGFTL